MRRVYLSFLGLGQFDNETGRYAYKKAVYELDDRKAKETCFVQVAEQELLGDAYFDWLYIAATEASYEMHGSFLKKQLSSCRGTVKFIILDEDMSEKGQWKWFEEIAKIIQEGDLLTVDLTHGYRSIPVIFSTAINFLQKIKKVRLEHVFYGAYEKDRECTPLVDMRSFYDINTWADAVMRLSEDADATGMAVASEITNSLQFPELSDKKFVSICASVTRRIKNVDINNVSVEVWELREKIKILREDSSVGTRELLDLVDVKFASLSRSKTLNPDRDGYTISYFRDQLELVALLIQHGLLMQAFTVMRQWLSSLVMLHFERTDKMKAKKRRKRQQYYGDIFFNMLQYPEDEWRFSGEDVKKQERIQPWFAILKESGVLKSLIEGTPLLAKELSEYRNGLDHAWIGRARMKDDIEEKAEYFLECLKDTCSSLEKIVPHDVI